MAKLYVVRESERPLTDEEREQAESYGRLAIKIARRRIAERGARGELEDEVIDGAVDGFLNAMRTFDPTLGRLTNRIYCCVNRRIGTRVTRYYEAQSARPEREGYFEGSIPDPGAFGDEHDTDTEADMARVRAALGCLTPRQRLVVDRLYGLDGMPAADGMAALAKTLGVSPTAVKALRDNAILKLQHALRAGPAFRRLEALASRRKSI